MVSGSATVRTKRWQNLEAPRKAEARVEESRRTTGTSERAAVVPSRIRLVIRVHDGFVQAQLWPVLESYEVPWDHSGFYHLCVLLYCCNE